MLLHFLFVEHLSIELFTNYILESLLFNLSTFELPLKSNSIYQLKSSILRLRFVSNPVLFSSLSHLLQKQYQLSAQTSWNQQLAALYIILMVSFYIYLILKFPWKISLENIRMFIL